MACKHGSMVSWLNGSDLSARPVTRIMSVSSQSHPIVYLSARTTNLPPYVMYQKLAATDMVIECQCSTAERTHRTTIIAATLVCYSIKLLPC